MRPKCLVWTSPKEGFVNKSLTKQGFGKDLRRGPGNARPATNLINLINCIN